MDNIPSEVLLEITTYLIDYEILQFSNTAKFDLEFNREKHKKNIIYKKLMPILTFGPDNALWCEEMWHFEDIKSCLDGGSVHPLSYYIHELSIALLNAWKYPIEVEGVHREQPEKYSPHYYAKSFAAANGFNGEPIIYHNEKICMIYRCLFISGARYHIKNSLTLRALIG